MARQNGKPKRAFGIARSLTSISVEGFKSFFTPCSVPIRPLTILAGANSSGKSSLMQPFLLMKQTLDAPYDPGALRLDKPNVKFTSTEQILSRRPGVRNRDSFSVGFDTEMGDRLELVFRAVKGAGFQTESVSYTRLSDLRTIHLRRSMSTRELTAEILAYFGEGWQWEISEYKPRLSVRRVLLGVDWAKRNAKIIGQANPLDFSFAVAPVLTMFHLPGLRGNPEREYPAAAVNEQDDGNGTLYVLDGVFSLYTASIILHWQEGDENDRLGLLDESMKRLGLTSRVRAERVDDTRIRVNVARLLQPPARKGVVDRDMVNIADVGVGVSHVLPVVVALIAAAPDQVVYIEEPEIHLHPRAQVALAGLLVEAAKRGVRVIAETHSDLLLRGVQTQIAQGSIDPSEVALHWFSRDKHGATTVQTAELDEAGRTGDWPEDFTDTDLRTEDAYLAAAEKRVWETAHAEEG